MKYAMMCMAMFSLLAMTGCTKTDSAADEVGEVRVFDNASPRRSAGLTRLKNSENVPAPQPLQEIARQHPPIAKRHVMVGEIDIAE